MILAKNQKYLEKAVIWRELMHFQLILTKNFAEISKNTFKIYKTYYDLQKNPFHDYYFPCKDCSQWKLVKNNPTGHVLET